MTLRTYRIVVGVLLLLVLVAGGATAWLATRPAPEATEPEISQEAYRPGSLPSDPGEDAVEAAVEALPPALSFDHRSLDEGLVDATALMTDDFATEFRTVFARTARPRAVQKKAVARALVRGAGLVRLEGEEQAFCLVYVDQVLLDSASMAADKKPVKVSQNRVLVGMKKVDGTWLLDSIQPF